MNETQLRDREGIEADLRERLVAVKKADLGAMMGAGPPQPPGLAALLFTDIERGEELYESPGVESGLVGQYLGLPLGGMFGAGEL